MQIYSDQTYTEAKTTCESIRSYLPLPKDEQENEALSAVLRATMSRDRAVWLGTVMSEGQWRLYENQKIQ